MSEAGEFHRRVAAVAACPFCGAAVGTLCRTARGRRGDQLGAPAQGVHSQRIDAFSAVVR